MIPARYYHSSRGVKDDGKVMIASMGTGGYDWSTFALFRDEAGRLYTASDSGCSCNGPWEDYPDYSPVDSVQAAIDIARSYLPKSNEYGYDYYTQSDVDGFIQEALEA